MALRKEKSAAGSPLRASLWYSPADTLTTRSPPSPCFTPCWPTLAGDSSPTPGAQECCAFLAVTPLARRRHSAASRSHLPYGGTTHPSLDQPSRGFEATASLAAAHLPIPRLRLRLSHSLRETPGSRLLTTRCQLRRPCHRRMRHESYSLTPGLATRARRCKAASGCTWPSIRRTTSRRPHSRAHRTPSPAATDTGLSAASVSHACTPHRRNRHGRQCRQSRLGCRPSPRDLETAVRLS